MNITLKMKTTISILFLLTLLICLINSCGQDIGVTVDMKYHDSIIAAKYKQFDLYVDSVKQINNDIFEKKYIDFLEWKDSIVTWLNKKEDMIYQLARDSIIYNSSGNMIIQPELGIEADVYFDSITGKPQIKLR